jgi:hypothetical protein
MLEHDLPCAVVPTVVSITDLNSNAAALPLVGDISRPDLRQNARVLIVDVRLKRRSSNSGNPHQRLICCWSRRTTFNNELWISMLPL